MDSVQAERANSYRQMSELWAWKDFVRILGEIRQSALESAITCADIKDVQLQRGKVAAIDEIRSTLSFIIEPI